MPRAAAVNTNPDFAFPQNVEREATADLSSALDRHDVPATVDALIRLTVAANSVDPANVVPSLSRIDSLRVNSAAPAERALLSAMMADIYRAMYFARRWDYDRRVLPLAPLPADPSEWSGEQYRHMIIGLLEESVADAKSLSAIPLFDYKSIVAGYDETQATLYPTLYDFLAWNAIDILSDLTQVSGILSSEWLFRFNEMMTLQLNRLDPLVVRIMSLYASLESLHASDAAPLTLAETRRVLFTNRMVFYPGNTGNEWATSQGRVYSALSDVYDKFNPLTPYALITLTEMNNYAASDSLATDLYNRALGWKEKWGSATPVAMSANSIISRLSTPQANVMAPDKVAPAKAFNVNVEWRNARKVVVTLRRGNSQGEVVERHECVSSEPVPFSASDTLSFTAPRYGRYYLGVELPGHNSRSSSGRAEEYNITATDIATAITTLGPATVLITTDILTGRPVEGAKFTFSDYRGNPIVVSDKPLVSDTRGLATVNIPTDKRISRVSAAKASDRFSQPVYVGWRQNRDNTTRYSASVVTDRSLYHQGDSISCVALASWVNLHSRGAADSLAVKFTLFNADGEPVDTVESVTDIFGRACAGFNLPAEGKTGSFMIQVADASDGRYLGSQSVMVSDYRLPSFFVKIKDIAKTDSSARIVGQAMGYDGMPVSGANVVATMRARVARGWSHVISGVFFTDTLTTDSQGCFTLDVEPSALALSPLPAGQNIVDFDVLSPLGETRSVSTAFTTGPAYSINLTILQNQIDVADPVSLDVKLMTPTGEQVENGCVTMYYKLMRGDKVVKEAPVGSSTVDWSDVAPGVYSVVVMPDNPALATPSMPSTITLYSRNDNRLPVPVNPFWTPANRLTANAEGKVKIPVLADVTSPTVYILSATVDSLLPVEVQTLTPGWHDIEVSLPEGRPLSVRLYSTYALQTYNTTVYVVPPTKPLKVETASFRDNLVSGATEKWHLKVYRDGLQTTTPFAVVAGMWNAALDALQPHSISPAFPSLPTPSLNINYLSGQCYESVYPRVRHTTPLFSTIPPTFNLYGQRWLGGGNRRFLMRTMNTADGVMVEEEVMEEKMMAGSAPVMIGSMKNASAKMDLNDSATVVEEAADAEADGGNSEPAQQPAAQPSQEVRYRDAEVPVAFFLPTLTTDPDGNLTIDFTLPEANATWQLGLAAYDKALSMARLDHVFVASKPVMVKTRAPRFLRRGDKAVIVGEVSNSTDSLIDACVTAEILTPSGRVIAERKREVSVKEKVTVDVEVEVPTAGVDTLIYRLSAVTGDCSDGEMTRIPVLDVWQPVIDSTPFYCAPDSTVLRVKPEIPEGSEVEVTLTDNAAIEVAKALPDINKPDPTTSIETASALYSAAVTACLSSRHPAIAENLTGVADASGRIPELIKKLAEFESPKGGWQWIAGDDGYDEPSMWATENILSMLADLVDLDAMPKSDALTRQARRAIAWIDKEEKKQWNKWPDSDFTRYTYLRLRLESISPLPSTAKTIITATGNRLAKDWRSLDLAGKGVAAIILEKTGHGRDARLVAESLRQLATTDPVQGMCWRQLDTTYAWSMGKIGITSLLLQAFNEIDPGRPEVDAIRQWLVIRKLALDWGATIGTIRAVSSILTTGTDWTLPSTPATYHWEDGGKELVVEKPGVHPAWGAVMARYTGAMTEIPAHCCPEISIEKRLFKRVAGPDGDVAWKETKEMKVGDKMRIDLLIKADTDMDYVTVEDSRAACLEPVKQLPGWEWADGLRFYRENRDSSTRLFITHLVRGTYRISIEMDAATAGTFTSGIATATCQQAPQLTAHTAGATLTVVSE